MRTMHDSTTAADIPKNATMVLGYIDGRYVTVPALRKRFPHATVVTTTVLGTAGAHVADCETGDLTPKSAAAWAKREVEAGRKPTVYFPLSWRSQVEAAIKAAGITGKVSLFGADYTGKPHLPAGLVACQYADPNTSGGHYDLSVVADYWPGVDPAPKPVQPLGPVTRLLIRRLTRRLAAQKRRPPAHGRNILTTLAQQITRVKGL